MSHLLAEHRAILDVVADEMREVHEERGYRVSVALAADRAFTANRRPELSMIRNLVVEAVVTAASRAGVDARTVPGGGLELRLVEGGVFRVFRLRCAERRVDGTFRVSTNRASTWGTVDEEVLIPDEPWVLCYTLTDDGIGEIFCAKVLDIRPGNPGYLVLGASILLGSSTGPFGMGGSFLSVDDETLEGLDDDESDGLGEAWGY